MESVTFSITKDGEVFVPPVVEKISVTAVESVTRQTNQCGETEAAQTGAAPYQLEINGSMLGADKEVLKRLRLRDAEALITNDIHTGSYIITDVEITQSDDEVTGEYPDRVVSAATERAASGLDGQTPYRGKAFSFRIMTEDPSQNSN